MTCQKEIDIQALITTIDTALAAVYSNYILSRNPLYDTKSITHHTPAIFVIDNSSDFVSADGNAYTHCVSTLSIFLRLSVAEEDAEKLFLEINELESLMLKIFANLPTYTIMETARDIGQLEVWEEIKIKWLHKP